MANGSDLDGRRGWWRGVAVSALGLALQTLCAAPLFAQSLILNEVSNGPAGSQEYWELVAVGSAADPTGPFDFTGWIIDDNNGDFEAGTGTGVASGYIQITGTCLSSVEPGSLIVIYNAGAPNPSLPADDVADGNDDNIYVIPSDGRAVPADPDTACLSRCNSNPTSSDPSYIPCTGGLTSGPASTSTIGLRNGGDAAQVRDPSGAFVHGFSYGDVDSASNPTFNIPGTGTQRDYFFGCGDFFDSANFTRVGVSSTPGETPGVSNDMANAIFRANVAFGLLDYDNPAAASNCVAPTHTVISSFQGGRDAAGQTVLTWDTASEVATVGFHLRRLDPQTGTYRPVTERLLPALRRAQGGRYHYVDHDVGPGEDHDYLVVEREANGRKRSYGPFSVNTGNVPDSAASYRAPMARAALSGFSAKAHGGADTSKRRRSAATLLSQRRRAGPGNLRRAIRIEVREPGLYRIDSSEIAAQWGVSERLVGMLARWGFLRLHNAGRSVAWHPGPDGAGLFFYGQGLDSNFSRDNVYWLKLGRGRQMPVVSGEKPAPAEIPGTFAERRRFEEDRFPAPTLATDPSADYWYWDAVTAGQAGTVFTVPLRGVDGGGPARLRIALKGASDTPAQLDHRIRVSLNGSPIGEGAWDGLNDHVVDLPFDPGLLGEGDNLVELSAVLGAGVSHSTVFVDSFEVSYRRRHVAVDDALEFRGNGDPVLTVAGFREPDIRVFDITDPVSPKVIAGATIDELDSYRVSFGAESETARYLAISGARVLSPSLGSPAFTGLRREDNRAEFVVIAPLAFEDAARVLSDYRRGSGLSSRVVGLESIYDTFNAGIAHPRAISRFLKYAYTRWEQPPRYVVLAGDGTFDYRDLLGAGDNWLPPLMAATPAGLFAADTRYGDVDGDGLPEMAIGRIPADSAEDLLAFVKKLSAYEAGAGAWRDRVLLLADNPDASGDFPVDSDDLAELVPPVLATDRVDLSEMTLADARSELLQRFRQGAGLINYIGHGGLDRLAAEGLLATADVATLANGGRLPFVAALTCVAGRFAVPGFDGLGEELVLADGGGAVAVWAPSGLSVNLTAKRLNEQLFEALFEDGETVLGDAILLASRRYTELGTGPFMTDIYNLLGDPATNLR